MVGHQNHVISLLNQVFDSLEAVGVYIELLDASAHGFAEDVHEGFDGLGVDVGSHGLGFPFQRIEVECEFLHLLILIHIVLFLDENAD